jgi:formylglycine-generating enzyme required for sulfatase activity
MMKTLKVSLIKTICITVLLLITACSFPFVQILSTQPSATPTEEVAVTTEADTSQAETETPYDFGPLEAGTLMQWIDSSTVVYVPGGAFIMGHDETQASDHRMAHSETLDAFWIYQTEVTNAQYAACVAVGECSAPDTTQNEWYTDTELRNAPVTGVTYAQAQTYCEWVDARLPTEAEWELAARGTDGATYPWGEDEPDCTLLNYEGCFTPAQPQIVRGYLEGASPYNLADMAGNAAEWVYDWYSEDYYQTTPANNPTGPSTGTERVVRGSSFLTVGDGLEIYLRASFDPLESRADLGFRCVLTGETASQPVLPLCTILSYSPSWPEIEGWPHTIVIIPDPTLTTYCNLATNGDMYGTMAVHIGTESIPSLLEISSPDGTLNCEQDSGDDYLFNCIGSALHPGTSSTIHICQYGSTGAVGGEPTCPAFYNLNPTTNMCFYYPEPLMCAPPYVPVTGYGCMPTPDCLDQCPVGYVKATFEGTPVCIPASGETFCTPGGVCAAECPAGLIFNEGSYCCDYPADVSPQCPSGYSYDEASDMCVPDPALQVSCHDYTVTVGTCAPVQTPPPTGCLINVGVVAFQLECQSPCPVGVQNYGPCTP